MSWVEELKPAEGQGNVAPYDDGPKANQALRVVEQQQIPEPRPEERSASPKVVRRRHNPYAQPNKPFDHSDDSAHIPATADEPHISTPMLPEHVPMNTGGHLGAEDNVKHAPKPKCEPVELSPLGRAFKLQRVNRDGRYFGDEEAGMLEGMETDAAFTVAFNDASVVDEEDVKFLVEKALRKCSVFKPVFAFKKERRYWVVSMYGRMKGTMSDEDRKTRDVAVTDVKEFVAEHPTVEVEVQVGDDAATDGDDDEVTTYVLTIGNYLGRRGSRGGQKNKSKKQTPQPQQEHPQPQK